MCLYVKPYTLLLIDLSNQKQTVFTFKNDPYETCDNYIEQ